MFFDYVVNLVHNHHVMAAVGLLWAVLSAILNVALRMHPLSYWVEHAEQNPRLASAAKLVQSAGFDPVGIIQAIVLFIFSEAKQPAPPGAKE